ncbi:---NA---, partial [Paramuricea clavata]
MSLKQKALNLLMFILVFALSEGNQNHSKIGFDHNFYYGSEGESAEICLVIERYVQRITGVITTADGTARRGVDYINTVLAILINSSEPVCYNINLPDDDDSEVLETFTVVFKTNDTNVQILHSNATVTITDDD